MPNVLGAVSLDFCKFVLFTRRTKHGWARGDRLFPAVGGWEELDDRKCSREVEREWNACC